MFSDLKSPFWIHLKGALFAFLILFIALRLFLIQPDLEIAIYLCLLIWASARFYYYLFYVIEKYVDPDFKFSGLLSAFKYLIERRGRERASDNK